LERSRQLQQTKIYNKATRDPRLNDKNIKGKERQALKDTLIGKVQSEVFQWLVEQPPSRFNALPQDSRNVLLFIVDGWNLT
jgi:hypothetical protein